MLEILAKATGWPLKTQGSPIKRLQPCNFCGNETGLKVAEADYWDLARINYIRCEKCELIQVDPLLSTAAVSKGCEAHFLSEQMREGEKNLKKNSIRSFRKGVYFARQLKKFGLHPSSILEVGPGDGYFAKGVRFVFPKAQVSCLDVVVDVLTHIEKLHGFRTLHGTPEDLLQLLNEEKFDLVIARDLIEHVENPSKVLEIFYKCLAPSGVLHIITPNGYEDIWTAYCHWKIKAAPAEMRINHVNFFPPKTLKMKLMDIGFDPLVWYIYDFNGTRWGRARKISEDQMLPTSQKISADQIIQEARTKLVSYESEDLLAKQWWVQPKFRLLTYIYCFLKEKRRFTLPADLGIGHEIFAILKKVR